MDKAMAIAASRFGLGASPQDDPGSDAKGWLKAQLQGPDPGLASGKFANLPSGGAAEDHYYQIIQQIKAFMVANPDQPSTQFLAPLTAAMRADEAAQLWFAATTPYSFRERLVWFWANHFSASVQSNGAGPFIGPMMREAIRPHITGNFTDLVLAAESHPGILRSLNNYNSFGPNSPVGLRTGRGLNENLGRECMELHTVSLAAGYSQTDVTNMAKILTGWSIGLQAQGADSTGFKYNANIHEPGPQTIMGHSFDGGQQAGIDALTFLSTYPTTYDFLAKKLVVHFVADNPPPDAVAHIAGVLRDTRGDLGAASAALVDLPQAWVPGQKFKTPFEYTISMVRAAPPPPSPKPPLLQAVLNQLGQPAWSAPLPNGWPDQAADWAGSDAVMARIDFAYTYAGRFGDASTSPLELADNALGPLLRPETRTAMTQAGSPREAMTLFLTAPEFQRR